MIKMQQRWIQEGIASPTPGGQIDTEAGFATVGDQKIAAFPKALWYMSRFLNYMPEQTGKWAIAACPVYKVGQPRSVGIGGTGTVVSLQSKHQELAAEFHSFYNSNRVICDDVDLMKSRLALMVAIKITLKNALDILAVSAPERM